MSRERPAHFTLDPVAPADFVGRADEARLLLSRVDQTNPPLQSLEGPSKIGRTSMLHYLRAICRGEAASSHLVGFSGDRIIAPYIDLTMYPSYEGTAESIILGAIATELCERKLLGPVASQGPATMAEVATKMRQLKDDGYGFLLLVDHGEHLLIRAGEPERTRWSRKANVTLGELNERVQIAVLLAFGATGPAKDLRAKARRLKMVETLDALSKMLNRGAATRTALGPLDDAEVTTFAERARKSTSEGKAGKLSAEEIEWIVDLAGGHPLVMQNAGVRLVEAATSGNAEEQRAELGYQLADPGLQGFLVDAFRRIGPLDETSAAQLQDLAEGETVFLEAELTTCLEEEGLIPTSDRSRGATMPSSGLRMALGAYLAARDATPAEAAPASGTVLALRDDESGAALRLTRSEHALMAILLDTAGASRDALKAALGPRTADPQLTQRVSVLRKKIDRKLGVEDAIESLYGAGYRLTEPERFELRNRQ